MKWIEISIQTTSGAVEAVSNILYDAGVTGVAIEDIRDLEMLQKEENSWELIDETLADTYLEGAVVKGYLPETTNVMDQVDLIRKSVDYLPQYGLDIGLGKVTVSAVDEMDWSNEWKKHFKPLKPGNLIVIKPSWEAYTAADKELVLEIDPGMAFGTGTHETTSLCIEELEKYVEKDQLVYDIGCGSGILSVAAALLGAKKVIGVDLDTLAVKISRENVALNKVEEQVEVYEGNLMDVLVQPGDLIVSNIIAEIIIKMCPGILKYLKPDGIWISSGIIRDKQREVESAIEKAGLEIIEVRSKGEWISITAKAPKRP
ncbi:MAG: 50S ribosomal protein L11 methyltransferase [Tindallia sp. MSAO_Bac2]|nr:MAG: 50S ribosomal protein L11 methyltransferase [Tindallia sp. MSAO_Bac2]